MLELLMTIIIMIMTSRIMSRVSTENEEDDTEKEVKSVKVILEEIGGQYYAWYFEPKDKFIVQSKTVDGLITELTKIFKEDTLEIVTSEEIKCQLEKLKAD
jgi:hypothetical protein